MRKIAVVMITVIFVLSMGVCFADNSTDIYISNEGSDSSGDGSIDNPYKTLDYTIEKVSNNSNIYLKGGVYQSSSDIDKSISITGIGDVSIDGSGSQKIFKINPNSSLKISNIRFVNGYADLEGEILSPIVNEGNLVISNSSFDNFTTIMGAIRNVNALEISNVYATNLNVKATVSRGGENPYGQFISNIGECRIENSNIFTSIYNNANMNIGNSYVKIYLTGADYLTRNVTTVADRSNFTQFRLRNSTALSISNSVIHCNDYHVFSSSQISLFNSTFAYNKNPNYSVGFSSNNMTAVSCIFNNRIAFGTNSNANITYSTILDYVSPSYYSRLCLNHNWWGDNKGPKVYKNDYATVTAEDWIVMAFSNDAESLMVDFTHFTDGDNINNLENPELFTSRMVKFEAESGYFNRSEGYLSNAVLRAKLLDANANTMIYAFVDRQVLRLAIGEGLTNYTWYVSDSEGNDYFCDGSRDNPFKTLKKAVSSAFSGNTIYVKEGVYTLSWNANLQISKNLTFVGLGGAVLSRPNNRNIFIVDDRGELNICNLTFTTYTKDAYSNPLVRLTGGSLNIRDSRFTDIPLTSGVIRCENQHVIVNVDNVTFEKVRGSAISGNLSEVNINNSRFINGRHGYYEEDSYVSVRANIYIFNSLFENSTQSMVSLNRKGYYNPSGNTIFISNSSFINNNWQKNDFFGLDIGVGRYFSGRYSVVDNCRFISNTGHLVFANEIRNCIFINNSAINFIDEFGQGSIANIYPNSLIEANNSIYNSYFEGNSYSSKSFEDKVVTSPNVYYSTFVSNSAAFGGALNNPNEVHYCVFVNNTGIYGGDDIFLYTGNLNASSNWWGSNQKPDAKRVQVFMGNLTLEDWVVMTLDCSGSLITAGLNSLLDNDRNYHPLEVTMPSREVEFTSMGGQIIPERTNIVGNVASATLDKNTSLDFDVFAKIDNQVMSLAVYNNSTRILVKNQTFYGKNNLFNITLINVNGHQISSQDLNVVVKSNGKIIDSYTLNTDGDGQSKITINYPIGEYEIEVTYNGNGYFEKTSQTALIKVSDIETRLTSLNYTYWGKNNKFYAILTDKNGKYILNEALTLRIYNNVGKLISTANVKTGNGGRADVLLSVDVGSYRMVWDYGGNEWYSKSHAQSFVEIKPINTTITLPSKTLYGKGNDYVITFRDAYSTLISDEIIALKIYNSTDSKVFNLKTEKGKASININLLPGVYGLEATYAGDDVYGPSSAKATLTVKPVFVTLDFNSHPELPLNGVFTVILKDMHGKRVSGEKISLELYDDGLVKTYDVVSDASGEANFKLDVGEGKYFAQIIYDGNVWYDSTTSAATITLNPNVIISNAYINGSDFVQYYGENKYYTIYFNDTTVYTLEDKIINVLISSKTWSKSFEVPSDIFGKARLQITLEPGTYSITYRYANEYYNIYAEGTNSLVIYRMPTRLVASNMVVNVAQPRNIEIRLLNTNGNALPNQQVRINVDGKKYNATTNANGVAKLLLNLGLGMHNVSYSFESKNYESSSGNITVLVVDSQKTGTVIEADCIEFYENDTGVMNVLLTDIVGNSIVSSEISVKIMDLNDKIVSELSGRTDASGIAQFRFNLNHGDYMADISYGGNDANLESYNSVNIHVKTLENISQTMIYANDCEIINGDESTRYSVVLTTVDGRLLSNKTVEFNVKNQTYKVLTNEFGRATLNVPLSPGSYEVTVTFKGTNNLTKSSIVNYLSVHGNVVNLYSKDIVKSYNNATHYFVALTDANDNPLSGKIIRFQINGKVYEDITDKDGYACFEVWLNPGKYEIAAEYLGEWKDECASVKNSITVLTTVECGDSTEYWDSYIILPVGFLNEKGESLSNAKVYFIYNNRVYAQKTDESGIAVLDFNLKAGKNTVVALNPKTYENKTFTVNIKSTILAGNLVKYYKGSSKFTVKLIDQSGNVLKNSKIKFKLNKKTYTLKTSKNGKASLKINLKPGKYSIVVVNVKTGEKTKKLITVKKTIITKNKVVKSSKKINFKIKILNSKGKIVKNAKVKVKVNKKTYTIKTNKKGIATLNIKLKVGKYAVTSSYGGLKVKNTIKVVK